MAKTYINERKRKQIKQRCIIEDEMKNKHKTKLKAKIRVIKESTGPFKRDEKGREEKRREEKRRYLLFRGRAILKKSTLKKLALI